MIQKVIKYFTDCMERYKIRRQIRESIWNIYDRNYGSMEEANSMIQKLIGLIKKAEDFNERATVKPIDLKRFNGSIGILEQRIEEDYFLGNLPIR